MEDTEQLKDIPSTHSRRPLHSVGMRSATLLLLTILLLFAVACQREHGTDTTTVFIEGLGLNEQEVIDSWVYAIARYLVIRQEHIDLSEEGIDYNVIKFNELGKADFVNPNLDVAYLEAWLGVDDQTPVILEIPRIEGRYYTVQIMDEWGDILYNINVRNFPMHPYGRYSLCLKGSAPLIPADALRLDLPSQKAKMVARIERGGDDEGAVRLQREFKITTPREPNIAPAVVIPMFSNADLITVEAFDQPMLNAVLSSAPDAMSVAPVMQEKARAIADFIAKDAANQAIIKKIIAQNAVPSVIQYLHSSGDNRGGWISTTGRPKGFGDDFRFRAAVNYAGIWWNNNQEAVYYIGQTDSSGNTLNGDNVYVLHIREQDLPQKHVNAFWSLTLLSLPDYRVVPNALDRYHFNNLSELTYEPDGSLKLYVAAVPPGDAPAMNWLPAPKGRSFTLTLRMYAPKEEVISGVYYAPPIEKSL